MEMHYWEHQFGMKRNIDKEDNFKSKKVQNKKFRFDSKQHQSGKKRKFDKGDNFKNMMSKFDKKQKQIGPNKPICEKCGKKHFGQCLVGSGKCYRCGEVGHRKMKCPLEKKNNMPECFEGQAHKNKFLEGTCRPSNLQCYEKQLMHVEGEISESKPVITHILAITTQKTKEFEEAVTEMSDKMNGQTSKLTIEVEKQNCDQHSSKKSDLDEGDNFKNTKLKGDKQEQIQSDRPMCGLCKKKHFGQCLSGTEKCFKCGEVGHLKRNCRLEKKNSMQEVFQGQAQQNKVLEDNSILGISEFYGKQSLHVEGEAPENQINQSMKIRAFALTSQNVEGFEEVIIDKINGQTSKLTIEVEMQNCEQKSSQKSDLDEGDFKNTKLRRDMQDLIQSNKPMCEHCGKKHFGQCLSGTEKCFSCGEVGHLKRNCRSEKKKYISEAFLGQAQQEVLEDSNILGIPKFYGKQSLHVEGETSEKKISQPMKTRAFALTPQKVEGFEEVKIEIPDRMNRQTSELTIEAEKQNCEQQSIMKSDLGEGDNFKSTKLKGDKQEKIQSDKPMCGHCGKKHFGQCLSGIEKCFSCGEVGHLKWNCRSEKKNNMLEVFQGQAQQKKVLEDNKLLGISMFYEKQSLHVEGETSEKKISQPMKTRSFALTPQKVERFEEEITVTGDSKNMSNSLELARKEFTEFEEKVKKSVLLSDLSPEVTTAVLKMALEQFGNVVNIEFIPNLTIPYDMPQCALVEMEHAEMASKVIKTMKDFPFMISGMPRPVSANPAKAEMFSDRPAQPGRKINFRWVDKSNPDFEVGERLKRLCSRHGKESLALAQLQLEEEEKLAKQQEDMVLSNYKKHEMIELLLLDGIAARLAHRYGIDLSED